MTCGLCGAIACVPAQAGTRAADPDIAACIKPETMAMDDIYACLDKLVQSANAELDAAFAKAEAAVDPQSAKLLRKAEDSFYAYRKAEIAASRGPWRGHVGHPQREVAGMTNAITAARERRDELLRLYVDRD